MANPLVSVIVPLYNKEQWVVRCIESIVCQSYQNMEILIIDDGSTDESRHIASTIQDPRVKIIEKLNGGVSSARNIGMEIASGEYIAFIDADDRWELGHITLLVLGFEKYKNAVLVANRLDERVSTDDRDEEQGRAVSTECIYHVEEYILSLSQNIFSLHIGSSMFKKSMLDEYRVKFYEHIKIGEDINFLIRVSRLGEFILSECVGLIYYRDDESGAMNSVGDVSALVPQYFYGMESEKWSDDEKQKIVMFLRSEYFKKAYQNRKLPWRKEEMSTRFAGRVEIGKVYIVPYLFIRYIPEFIYSLYRKGKR
ncbi:MAG: glycosyltransferase family 2 protein [Campylobacterota bacterium]|nr:glycosyltransferase family 2 protein [Campylobacterota bacterium]